MSDLHPSSQEPAELVSTSLLPCPMQMEEEASHQKAKWRNPWILGLGGLFLICLIVGIGLCIGLLHSSAEKSVKQNCSILLIGGLDSSMEWFHPWAPSENRLLDTRLLTPREGPISAVLADGRVLIAGGSNGLQPLSSVELLDVQQESLSWGPSMANKRSSAAAVAVDGVVFVCGGWDRSRSRDQDLSGCERFRAGNWTAAASMQTARSEFALVALDGKLYAIGGMIGSLLSVVEAYDIRRDVWTTKSPMPTAQAGVGAAVWGQSILACGGWNGSAQLSVCEKYDVGVDRWTSLSPMNMERNALTLTAVGDWLVAVGGFFKDSAEIYSPERDQWTLLSTKLKHKRYRHSAVVVCTSMTNMSPLQTVSTIFVFQMFLQLLPFLDCHMYFSLYL